MIRIAERADLDALAGLALELWPDHTATACLEEFSQLMDAGTAFFLESEGDKPIAFAQCGLGHDYVEGINSSPVGYLEGIFVKPEYRHKGIAQKLLAEAEAWAKRQGCTEFASDCELENSSSRQFHLRMGFAEANRIVCFTKRL